MVDETVTLTIPKRYRAEVVKILRTGIEGGTRMRTYYPFELVALLNAWCKEHERNARNEIRQIAPAGSAK